MNARTDNNTDWVWCFEHPKTAARLIDEQSTEIGNLQAELDLAQALMSVARSCIFPPQTDREHECMHVLMGGR